MSTEMSQNEKKNFQIFFSFLREKMLPGYVVVEVRYKPLPIKVRLKIMRLTCVYQLQEVSENLIYLEIRVLVHLTPRHTRNLTKRL